MDWSSTTESVSPWSADARLPIICRRTTASSLLGAFVRSVLSEVGDNNSRHFTGYALPRRSAILTLAPVVQACNVEHEPC